MSPFLYKPQGNAYPVAGWSPMLCCSKALSIVWRHFPWVHCCSYEPQGNTYPIPAEAPCSIKNNNKDRINCLQKCLATCYWKMGDIDVILNPPSSPCSTTTPYTHPHLPIPHLPYQHLPAPPHHLPPTAPSSLTALCSKLQRGKAWEWGYTLILQSYRLEQYITLTNYKASLSTLPMPPTYPFCREVVYSQNYITKHTYSLFEASIHWTTMGTKMTPSYVNIFMHSLERQFL